MTRFKEGDFVRVRKWNDMEQKYGLTPNGSIDCSLKFIQEMKKYCGRVFRIHSVVRVRIYNGYFYSLCGSNFNFSDDMLDPFLTKH